MGPGWDVYLAAPLFNRAEREFNLRLTAALEALGLRVFLPQRDGLEFAVDDAPDRARRIFDLDMATVEATPAMVAVLDGAVPDDGVCVELGAARQHARTTGTARSILGLKTDDRSWQQDGELNPMVLGCLDALFRSESALLDFIAANLERIRSANPARAQQAS